MLYPFVIIKHVGGSTVITSFGYNSFSASIGELALLRATRESILGGLQRYVDNGTVPPMPEDVGSFLMRSRWACVSFAEQDVRYSDLAFVAPKLLLLRELLKIHGSAPLHVALRLAKSSISGLTDLRQSTKYSTLLEYAAAAGFTFNVSIAQLGESIEPES